ncbi:amino acid adenylation domain-containing protein [Pseudomonas sp. EMN2]|uniref:non-ribosomal peptide synthetase n=1 Tax=Pseudomonas sp. EMN2 TaxID=2615212 RepID=UPI00129AA3B2|nr:amino acid adenylation domain-containing protein [Pseudomonas sp. EMN2]
MTASNAEIFQTSAQQAHLLQASGGQALAARLWLALDAEPSLEALQQALAQLCERHEILRTRYVQVPGLKHPAQEIHAQVNLRVRHAATAEQARLQVAEDLGQAPLAASLEGRNLLLGVALASADPAALRLLGDELQALLRGEALAEFDALQYADYAAWQGDLAQESIGQQGRAFWRGLLAEQARPLALPFERRVALAEAPCVEQLATPVADALAKVAEAGRITTDEALAVLWAAFLVELGQPASVVLGLEVSGRNEQLEQTVGHFARQLPLVLAIDSSRGLREQLPGLLGQLRQGLSWLDCLDETDLGEALLPAFACGYRAEAAQLEQDWPLGQKLLLRAEQRGQGLSLRLVSPARVFDAAQLQAWLAQFARFAVQVAADLEQPLSRHNGVDSAQAEQLLQRFDRSAEQVEVPGETLHGLFEQAAKATPGHTALQVGAQALDYASLDQRANGLAQALRERGVGPDSVVAVYGERSVEIVVTLLAILKAGGAYLPLDPSYPAERLAFMLHDARAQCLITLRPLADGIEVPDGVARLALEQGLPAAQVQAPAVAVEPGNLAYVIYTSGSTGKPKGVMISHANACASTRARGEFYRAPLRRFLMLSSFSFDSSVAGIFWTLGQGGTLYLPEEQTHKDPARLAQLIGEQGISHFLALPSFYAQILEHLQQPALACVIVAGEACPLELPARHAERLPQTLLVNEYGPSESSVWCSAHVVEALPAHERVSIGGAIAGTRLRVLDEQGELVGFGREGELYVGGPGLARGYLQRPGLTASRFVPDPFALVPGQRLYRTGDRVSPGVEGTLDYLGRLDFQLKLRGFRVELGEIEARLAQQPEVREAAVVVRETGAGAQLAAFATLRDPASASGLESRLLERLREQMPEYMVPAFLRVLDRLPLTPNGKLDRTALAALQAQGSAYQAPRNELEQTLAQIWQEALQLEQVGVHDNFFALGGHSLLATRIRSQVQERLNLDLPLRVFFEGETVALLAEQVERHRGSGVSEDKADALEALFDAVEDV